MKLSSYFQQCGLMVEVLEVAKMIIKLLVNSMEFSSLWSRSNSLKVAYASTISGMWMKVNGILGNQRSLNMNILISLFSTRSLCQQFTQLV